MIPFLHIGPVEVPTFGLMVAAAMVVGYFVLRADMARRGIAAKSSATAEMFIVVPCLAGIVGAKLYHVLEAPRELFAHPAEELLSRYGLAWFGGLIGGFAAWVWLARQKRIPLLESFDAGSAAAAVGYGVGRIGCLLSGDGDYGVPTSLPWGMSFPNGLVPTTERVHPTPVYELIVACGIAWVLWRIGTVQIAGYRVGTANPNLVKTATAGLPEDQNRRQDAGAGRAGDEVSQSASNFRPYGGRALAPGNVFAAYLVMTGAARLLVEFIRINPRSFFGLTNAQAASIVSMIAGVALWWSLSRGPRQAAAEHSGAKPPHST